jgi:hypothetical protein
MHFRGVGRPRKPRPSLRLFSNRLTVREAEELLELHGSIDRRARVYEESSGRRDGLGRPYTKWVARYGKQKWSLSRESVADVQQALALLAAVDAETRAAELRKAAGAPPLEPTGTRPK